ncbi:MAG: hypothetical protein ACI87E_001042 [Mariniblastus sp.]|jgi:hypothetical protein
MTAPRQFDNAMIRIYLTSLACLTLCISGFLAGQANGQSEDSFSPLELEFFENKIRPLLVEHCLSCHGNDPEKLRGGLRLTSRIEILQGGDSGPAIVAGDPKQSLLVSSLHYDDFEMPPQGQLEPEQIAAFETWIKMGAPDPRAPNQAIAEPLGIDIEAGKKFWAFAPRKEMSPPPTNDHTWPETDIDRYVLATLESKGIRPVRDGSRTDLIRRVHLALTGLPPTVQQIDSFLNDGAPTKDALANVVNVLLDSPHFGERWGRHWLDVVRFAESSGGGRSLMFPEAWRFRNYVIDSFNADKAFDQFIREQIAGDILSSKTRTQRNEQIVGAGMLVLGPTNYEQQDKERLRHEVIDEQVDTVGRAFLGLTLGCARCHDHKFDPIPMTDYYALAGIFGSTESLIDGNVSTYVSQSLGTEAEIHAKAAYQANVSFLSGQLANAKSELQALTKEPFADKSGVGNSGRKNQLASELQGLVIDDRAAKLAGDWIESQSEKRFVDGHYLHDDNRGKANKSVVFAPKFQTGGEFEVRIAYSAGGNRASNTPVKIDHQDGQTTILVNQTKTPPIDGLFLSLGKFRFEADATSLVTISTEATDGHVIVDAIQFLQVSKIGTPPQPARPATAANVLEIKDDKQNKPLEQSEAVRELDPELTAKIKRLNDQIENLDRELKTLKKNGSPTVAVAMSVKEGKSPRNGHLHIRGSIRNLGPVVERGFISVCGGETVPSLSESESGRLQLAEWIASAEHPLTARVYVNRVWRHLFGHGLVATTDNFGFAGQTPSHPELLDYLANEFVANGWSTKTLIRKIIDSHVYRLSSEHNEQAFKVDQGNRLLWRAHRRRVDAEVLRDSILFTSGQLDLTAAERTIRKLTQYDLGYEFKTVRRSVYVPAFRNSVLDIFEVFDFANPNLVTGHRNTSTLPTQALFLMNNPMVIEQSEHAAHRFLAEAGIDESQRVALAYRTLLGRKPSNIETEMALTQIDFVSSSTDEDDPKLAGWRSLCQALFASLDFRYVD